MRILKHAISLKIAKHNTVIHGSGRILLFGAYAWPCDSLS